MKLKLFLAIFIIFAISSSLGMNPVSAKEQRSLQIKGSDTMVNLVQAWAEGFMKDNPETFVAVTGGGSGTGIASLISGTCDLAMSSRSISSKEAGLAAQKGAAPKEYKVALDGLAVVVNPNNPISKLTVDELADIFSGRVTRWKEVGGEDLEIVVLSREVNSGTHVYFKEHVLRKGDPKSKEEFSPDALLLPSSQAIADEVVHNRGAIGYYGMGYIGQEQKALSVSTGAEAGFVYPTVEDVILGNYPISRPLFFYTRGEPEGTVKQFLDFVLSAQGQAIVSEIDFVPIKR